jgi:RNA recognition motif-containing protein
MGFIAVVSQFLNAFLPEPILGFVEFEDDRDASDAVRGLDGKSVDGERLRVEFSRNRMCSIRWQVSFK